MTAAPAPLTSDPHAWLRPYFAALAQTPAFPLLAPALQFAALCASVEDDRPDRAQSMREWSLAAQEAALRWLKAVCAEHPPAAETELWTVRKAARELRCVARYLPHGIDLRLMQGDEFRRTELLRDAPAATARAEEWKVKLQERGWS
jgi:hypothetical protein